jgi:hypothetical protein
MRTGSVWLLSVPMMFLNRIYPRTPGKTRMKTGRIFRAPAKSGPSWASFWERAPRTRWTMVWSVHQYQMPRIG